MGSLSRKYPHPPALYTLLLPSQSLSQRSLGPQAQGMSVSGQALPPGGSVACRRLLSLDPLNPRPKPWVHPLEGKLFVQIYKRLSADLTRDWDFSGLC